MGIGVAGWFDVDRSMFAFTGYLILNISMPPLLRFDSHRDWLPLGCSYLKVPYLPTYDERKRS